MPNLWNAMPSMPNLVELNLGSNKIRDAGAEKIAAAVPGIPNLRLWPKTVVVALGSILHCEAMGSFFQCR